jgi:hypothetical protein
MCSFSHVTRLIAWENFIESCLRDSFRSLWCYIMIRNDVIVSRSVYNTCSTERHWFIGCKTGCLWRSLKTVNYNFRSPFLLFLACEKAVTKFGTSHFRAIIRLLCDIFRMFGFPYYPDYFLFVCGYIFRHCFLQQQSGDALFKSSQIGSKVLTAEYCGWQACQNCSYRTFGIYLQRKSHSIALMTIANDNYELIFVDVGRNEEFLTQVCFSK